MSGSTARKIQPFTISTKLSLPKCSSDFPGDSCPGIPISALDNHVLHQNLNEQVSLYLAQASSQPMEGRFHSASPTEEGVTNEDRVNRNSLSRSIKKITLSNWGQHGEPGLGEEEVLGDPAYASCERNFNNNNCRTGKAQFKVRSSIVMCCLTAVHFFTFRPGLTHPFPCVLHGVMKHHKQGEGGQPSLLIML